MVYQSDRQKPDVACMKFPGAPPYTHLPKNRKLDLIRNPKLWILENVRESRIRPVLKNNHLKEPNSQLTKFW